MPLGSHEEYTVDLIQGVFLLLGEIANLFLKWLYHFTLLPTILTVSLGVTVFPVSFKFSHND